MADVQDQIFTMENEEKQLEADIKTVILKVTLFSHFLQFSSDASGKNWFKIWAEFETEVYKTALRLT